jgi:hypothetical protein
MVMGMAKSGIKTFCNNYGKMAKSGITTFCNNYRKNKKKKKL